MIPKIGNRYFYWSKSYKESRASKKFCILKSLNGKFARVLREDLDINAVQTILAVRLKEIPVTITKLDYQGDLF